MTIEQLQEKRDKAQEKYDKKLNIIEKHKAKKQKLADKLTAKDIPLDANVYEIKDKYGYDVFDMLYDYQGMDGTIKDATRNANEAYVVLNNWERKLQQEISNMEYINEYCPQVIRDFLDAWEIRTVEWYKRRYERFVEFKKSLEKDEIEVGKKVICEFGTDKAKADFLEAYNRGDMKTCWECIHNRNFDIRKQMNSALKEARLDYSGKKEQESFFGQMVLMMHTYRKDEERNEWLCKEIAQDKKRKMIDFVRRIEKIVGTIEDVSYLLISPQGDIDGLVIGDKGKAKVNTISAGGWNIQCFHYRVLVKKVK